MREKSITVVIPTYNGEKKIGNTLSALTRQTHKNFRVQIVIDGSNDRTEECVAAYKDRLNLLTLKIRNVGRAGARNRGVDQCSDDDLIIFLDDDMIPEERFIENHLAFHSAVKDSIVTGPQIKSAYSLTDYGRYERKKNIFLLNSLFNSDVQLLSHPFLTAANFSIHKLTFLRLGGFDARLSDGEDYDFAFRARMMNVNLYFSKKIYCDHLDGLDCKGYIARAIEYRRAGIKLMTLKREIYKTDAELKNRLYYSTIKYYLKFYLFSFKFWPKLIDNDRLVFLPEYLRYKLYDVIITSHVLKDTRLEANFDKHVCS